MPLSVVSKAMVSPVDRLAHDGIREAVCEIRFNAGTSPELVIGRLMDARAWSDMSQDRLGGADLPEQLRAQNAAIKFVPSYQLTDRRDEARSFRIGPYSASSHRGPPYPGWGAFGPDALLVVDALDERLPNAAIARIGLRYVNAFDGGVDGVESLRDLNVQVSAGDHPIAGDLALSYKRDLSGSHEIQITVATPDYVQTEQAQAFNILIDLDIRTPETFEIGGPQDAKGWIEEAHVLLKEEFFRLIPVDVLARLRG